jgi:hypothetical protein
VATSPAVTVISQNSGPAGANGTNGAQGANGTNGAQGPAGPRGPAGEIELVTCTKVKGKKKCTTRLTSSPQSFTTKTARASVSRAGHLYATGSLRNGTLTLYAAKALRAGRYTLWLTAGSGRTKHTTRESLTIEQMIKIG